MGIFGDDSRHLRRFRLLVGLLAVSLTGGALVSACSTGSSGKALDKDSAECEPYRAYQGHDDTTVTAYASIRDTEEDYLNQSWETFVGAPASRSTTRAAASSRRSSRSASTAATPPDLAFVPQPGLLDGLRQGRQAQGGLGRHQGRWPSRTIRPTG